MGGKPTVLIADDSRVFRVLMAEVLREKGLIVEEAADGRQAMDAITSMRPDLLVLDALMPVHSGFDILGRMRDIMPDYTPRVVIVTAVYKSRRWEREARQQFRVDEYLEKPLEPDELLEVVARYFPDVA